MMLVLRTLNDFSEALGFANQTKLQQEYIDNYETVFYLIILLLINY